MANYLDSIQIKKNNVKSPYILFLMLTHYHEKQICLSKVLSHIFREECITNVKMQLANHLMPVIFEKAIRKRIWRLCELFGPVYLVCNMLMKVAVTYIADFITVIHTSCIVNIFSMEDVTTFGKLPSFHVLSPLQQS